MNLGIDDTEYSDSDRAAESELGRILDAYLAAIEAGEAVDPEAVAAAHPGIADRFRACVPILHMSARIADAEFALDPAAGVRLGDFVLMRMIGQGGMGMVFEARQLSLNRQVALKALPLASTLDPRQLTRFQVEARAAAQLHHTNIVPIFSVGYERGVHFYAMQLIEGQTLSALVRDLREAGKPAGVRPRVVAELGLQAAEALEHAHRHGIVHRDVKPSNLMVDVRNNLWITDFGLARMDGDGGLTAQGDVLGTLRYMSPEQSSGDMSKVDHRTDVYSLGATLYELATLRSVHPGADRDELLRDLAVGEPRRPRALDRSIPRDLETIILRALSRDPAHRYATAGAMADDLRRFLGHRPIQARRPSLLRRAERWTRRHKAPSALLAFALLLATAGGVIIDSLAARNRVLDRVNRRVAKVRDIGQAAQYVRLNKLDQAAAILSRHAPAPGEEDERRFAWHYLWRLCHVRPKVLVRHPGDVYHVEYSPDGKTLATAGQDGTARIWDAATGALLRTFQGHRGDVDYATFSPDGKTLATCGDDGTVRLWDARDDSRPSVVLGRHAKESVSIAFSIDGRTLFSGDDLGVVKSWDVAAGRLLRSSPPLHTRIEAMAVSPDGRDLVVAASWSGMRTIDVGGLEWRRRLPGFLAVFAVAISRDGRIVAGAEEGGRVRLRIDKDGVPIERLLSVWPSVRVCGLSLSHDDRVLAACHSDGTTTLWDVKTGALLRTLRSNHPRIWTAAFSPDGRKLVACGAEGAVEIWDARDVQDCQTALLPRPIDEPISPSLTPGAFIASYVIDVNHTEIQTWDFAGRAMRPGPLYEMPEVHKGALSPDGARMAAVLTRPPWLQIVSADRHEEPTPLEGEARFSPPSEAIAKTGAYAFSSDGTTSALCVDGLGVFVWDAASGRLRGRVRDHVDMLALSPRGDSLAMVNREALRVLDLTSRTSRDYVGPGLGFPGVASFTADGRHVIVGYIDGRSLSVWDLDDPRGKPSIIKVDDEPTTLAVSPDGMIAACGSEAGGVTLADLASLQPVLTLDAHSGPIRQLFFSPDGSTLLAVARPAPNAPPLVKAWTFAPSAEPWLGPAEFSGR